MWKRRPKLERHILADIREDNPEHRPSEGEGMLIDALMAFFWIGGIAALVASLS